MREKCEEKLGAPVSCILYIEMFRKNQHKKTVRKLGMQMKSKIRDPVGAPVSCILLCKMFNKKQHTENSEEKTEKEITGASRWTCIGQPTFSLLIWKVHTFYWLSSLFGTTQRWSAWYHGIIQEISEGKFSFCS